MGKSKHGNISSKGKTSPYLVFVSHATADKWIAKTLCEKIEAVGAVTFRDDRDIAGGDDIPEQIRQHIIRSNEMVVLMTPESVNRQWVLVEVGVAWGRRQNARIIAILCHVKVDNIPNIIRSKKAVPINSFDEYLKELRQRVERHRS
ncbi:MAG: toll/interleukin-1 receptor domain-containing protein [Planctomycetes bacterium]|nr:toll/interleukin-1 receptor domain-containing protein [Planctomycetota bacterium]MBU4400925.1 toll/interleukin-1 receptor domain-containing protein [Planctomycetota bacterium]MCG2682461.1 toll/interleukin-1 receptor domain-containing protein [Planctomycetales bacterium]